MVEILHKGQHPYRHKAQEVNYVRSGVNKGVKTALDELYSSIGAIVTWKDPVATKALLPLTGNSINDARIVQDDGDTNPAVYVCIAVVGTVDQQWVKIADVDWGDIFDATVNDGDLVKKSGNDLTKVTGISELLIVAAQALASFSNDAGVQEVGSTLNTFNLSWAYNRDSDNPASQSINQGIGAIAVANRTYAVAVAGLTASTTYALSAIGDDTNPSSLNSTVYFRNKRYYGVDGSVITTGADVMSIIDPQGNEFGTSRAVTKTFDASIGTPPNYLYICYPQSWGSPSSTKFGGFTFTDYTETVASLTNDSGHTENYIILKTNNQYNGSGLTWQIL